MRSLHLGESHKEFAMRFAELVLVPAVILVGCGGSSTLTAPSPAPPIAPPVVTSLGAIGGMVTINGEALPIASVELQRGGTAWAVDSTSPSGSWERRSVPAGDYDVVVKTPPGLTCDATTKSATVRKDQRTDVNFACFGDVKGAILGFAANEFGAASAARVTLTGPVKRETISNRDGFFAFEGLPPGEYVLRWCRDIRASVRDGAAAFAVLDCS
jgi:hypothetical protein